MQTKKAKCCPNWSLENLGESVTFSNSFLGLLIFKRKVPLSTTTSSDPPLFETVMVFSLSFDE